MLMKIAGAGAGAYAASWAYQSFVVKKGDGSGFIEESEGFGLDDVVHWVMLGAGAYFGMSLLGKIGS